MSQFEEPTYSGVFNVFTSTQTEIRRRMKKWGYPEENILLKEFSQEDALFYIKKYMDEHKKYIGAQESAIELLQLYDLFIDIDEDKELKKDEVVGYWRLDNNIINTLKNVEQRSKLIIAVKNLYYRLAPGSIKAEDLNNDKVPELDKTSPAAQILLKIFDSVSSEKKDGTIRRIDMLAQIHKYMTTYNLSSTATKGLQYLDQGLTSSATQAKQAYATAQQAAQTAKNRAQKAAQAAQQEAQTAKNRAQEAAKAGAQATIGAGMLAGEAAYATVGAAVEAASATKQAAAVAARAATKAPLDAVPLTKGQHKKYEILICKLLEFANIDHDGVCMPPTVETKFRT